VALISNYRTISDCFFVHVNVVQILIDFLCRFHCSERGWAGESSGLAAELHQPAADRERSRLGGDSQEVPRYHVARGGRALLAAPTHARPQASKSKRPTLRHGAGLNEKTLPFDKSLVYFLTLLVQSIKLYITLQLLVRKSGKMMHFIFILNLIYLKLILQ